MCESLHLTRTCVLGLCCVVRLSLRNTMTSSARKGMPRPSCYLLVSHAQLKGLCDFARTKTTSWCSAVPKATPTCPSLKGELFIQCMFKAASRLLSTWTLSYTGRVGKVVGRKFR